MENLDHNFNEIGAKILETQHAQINRATEMFTTTLESFQGGGFNNINNSFGSTTRTMTDLFKKNIENATKILANTMRPLTDLTKFPNPEKTTRDFDKQLELLNNKMTELTKINQANFEALFKQFDSATKSLDPLTQQFKKELGAIAGSSQEKTKSIIDSYTTFATSGVEALSETFIPTERDKKTNDRSETDKRN